MSGSSERTTGTKAYRAGVALAVITSVLTVWTTIVRDDGTGMTFFLLVMAAAVGAVAAWFRPAGMARTMIGVAVMQILLGIAIATAPSTGDTPNGPSRALVFSAVFAVLWLGSAAFFGAAARKDRQPSA